MKISILTLTLITFFCTMAFADCYSAWLESFDGATTAYKKDQQRCSSAFIKKSMCFAEADAAYDKAIDTAGTAYYHCVM